MHFVYILGLYSILAEFASCFLLQTDEWSSWTVVGTQPCLRLRTRHCANTSVACNDKEFGLCPDVVAQWGEWSPLQCTIRAGVCIIARTRNCSVPTMKDCQSTEKGDDIHIWGDLSTCPCRQGLLLEPDRNNGHWEDWSDWRCQNTHGSCYIFRTRQCSVPVTMNCPPKESSQLKLWEDTCPCGNDGIVASITPITTTRTTTTATVSNTQLTTPSQPVINTTMASHWLEWEEWRCHRVDLGCMQSRWRQCSSAVDDCIGDQYELASCTQTSCKEYLRNSTSTGNVSSTENANKLPAWTEWEPWECHREQIGCVMYRYRHCINGSEMDCEAKGGKSYEMYPCTDTCKASTYHLSTTRTTTSGYISTANTASTNHLSTTLATTSGNISTENTAPSSQWSEWFYGKCSVSCGNGTTSRLRHCSTGRDVDCPGEPFETVPCTAINCPG